MYVVVWIVVILIILGRYVNAAKGSGRRDSPTRPPQTDNAGKWSGTQGAPQGGTYSQSARSADRRYAMPARPVQSAAYPEKKQVRSENTILQRARANAAEHFDDDTLEARGAAKLTDVPEPEAIMRDKALERHIHSGHESSHGTELSNQPGVDDFDTYHLLDEVNDLIVKGYSGDLQFERDFLAEGTELLNRISM